MSDTTAPAHAAPTQQANSGQPAQQIDPKAEAQARGRAILAERGLLKETQRSESGTPGDSGATGGTPGTSGKPLPSASGESRPGDQKEPGAASGDGASSADAEKPHEADTALAKRLARIARGEERLKAREEAIKAQESQLQRLQAFEEARTKGGRVAALRALFDAEEITGALYQELTDEVLAGAKPETDDERIRKQVQAEVDKREKERAEAEKKAKESAKTEKVQAYLHTVAATLEAGADRWPLVNRLGVDASDVVRRVEELYREKGQVPSQEEVLDYFEQLRSSEVEATGKYAPKTVEAKPGGTTTQTDNQRSAREPVAMPGLDAPYEERVAAIKRRFLRS